MTPKEKSIELIYEFYKCMPFKDVKLTACEEKPELIEEMEKLSAKQCALIAVNELILHSSSLKNYWIKVKEEINKL